MQWIKDIVTGLIETYGTRDIYELLDCLEVTIIKKHFLNPSVKARYFKDTNSNDYVYLSYDLKDYEEKYILSHELGHILLHDITCEYYNTSIVNKGKLEFQANYFASLLLLDGRDIDKCYLEDLTISQISSYLELPEELIQYRFDELISCT